MKFTELVDIDELRQLCESYTAITNAVTAILDLDGNILIATGWQDICTRFHRVNDATACRCRESDTILAGGLKKGEAYNIYKCKNGLVDVAVPIMIRGEHLANFFTGQFFTEPPDRDYFIRQAEEFGFDKDAYLEALERVPVFSEYTIKLMMNFFLRLVRLIGEMGLAHNKSEEINQKLQKSEERFQLAVQAAAIGIWDWDVVNNELTWDDSMYRLYGICKEEFSGAYSAWSATLHPEDREHAEAEIAAALRGERTYAPEFRIIRPDGAVRVIKAASQTFFDDQGKPLRLIGTNIDISERKQAENELQQERDKSQRYLDVAGVMFAVLDTEGRVTLMNPKGCEILGYDKEEIIGVDWFSRLLPERLRVEVKGVFQSLMAGESEPVEYYENPVLRKNGEERMIAFHNAVLRDESGKPTGILFSGEDITERMQQQEKLRGFAEDLEKQVLARTLDLNHSQNALLNLLDDISLTKDELEDANKKLKEMDRLKSMFIASMSHELRTPLNSVIGFSSILINEWVGPVNDEQKKNLQSILRSGKHLLSLINDVIDVSKIEAGMIEVSRDDFDLAELLTEVEQTFAQDALDRKLSLSVQQFSLPMHSDRRRLLQCIFNLVSNALKFTETGGVTVEVRHEERTGLVVFTITDTGIGIGVEDQNKLFQAFSRIQSHLTAKVLGTGLGLYLTKKIIVDILHGEINVTSEAGKGSSFRMTIPVRVEA